MRIQDSNVTIKVSDLNRSVAFYESIGFIIKNRWGDHYAQLTAPGITIGLHPASNENIKAGSGNVSLGFTAFDFSEIKSSLLQLNIAVTEREEEGGIFLHFNDPEGNHLYFIKPKW